MTWILLLIVIAVATAAWHFATDSRDGRDWMPNDTGLTARDMVARGC